MWVVKKKPMAAAERKGYGHPRGHRSIGDIREKVLVVRRHAL
jgi:hypothetical protein